MKCFVIQPFDDGPHDKRFEDVFKPALESAGLEVYRVDKDHSTQDLVKTIEENIRNADICLADISEDNPNVWYEVGYACARKRLTILVCLESSRSKIPFDIQHRPVIMYSADSPRDFEKLHKEVTERAKSLLTSLENTEDSLENDPLKQDEILSKPEMLVLVEVSKSNVDPTDIPPISGLIWDFQKRNKLQNFDCSLATNKLETKGFIEIVETTDPQDGFPYQGLAMTPEGWKWLRQHSKKYGLE
ncbi:MAG: TIR domain-containing protein [Gammaproteobacteria bacterium]|nr:TIR domain-containing protein [Gammaproteobacteria bacterium]